MTEVKRIVDRSEQGRTEVAYQYVVLRCVPRVEREEFVNVGVVVYAEAVGYLDCRWHLDPTRALALYADLDLAAVTDSLRTIEAICRGEVGRGLPNLPRPGQRFGWIVASRSTVIQPGPVHGGRCADPAAALDQLLRKVVTIG